MSNQRPLRAASRWTSIADGFLSDVRYAAGGLGRTPAFTAAVVLTLALSIGAAASIFSVVDRLYRQPDGVRDPDRVRRVHLRSHFYRRLNLYTALSYAAWRDLPKMLPPDVQIAAYSSTGMHVLFNGDDVVLGATGVTHDYFGLLGVRPQRGRFFAPDETEFEDPRTVAVISDRLWTDRFQRDPGIVGRTLVADSVKYTIVGVAPAGFHGVNASSADVWIPEGAWARSYGGQPDWYRFGHGFVRLIVRVPRGVDFRAVERMSSPGLGTDPWINDRNPIVSLADLRQFVSDREALGQFVAIPRQLALLAGIILLIAIANVSGLLLLRTLHRRREIAVRAALGASRWRLVRHVAAESVLLATLAGGAALLVTVWTGAALRHSMFADVRWADQPLNIRVVSFTIALVLVIGVAIGSIAAVQAIRPQLSAMLNASAPSATSHRSRIRAALLTAQTALALLLVVGAALYVGSVRNLVREHTGYDIDRLVQAWVEGGPATTDALRTGIDERLPRLPGVEGVARASSWPMSGGAPGVYVAGVDSLPVIGDDAPGRIYVTPNYFATVGIRVLSGRGFTAEDRVGTELVAVVNATMAKAVWPGESAIGKCVKLGKPSDPCRRVVGVVSDQHVGTRASPFSMLVFAPYAQTPEAAEYIGSFRIVRVAPEQRALAEGEIRRLLEQASAPRGRAVIERMAVRLEPELRPWRLTATLASAAGLLALLVASLGIYSSIAYALSQRTREIGIRIALGARDVDVIRITLNFGIGAVVAGVAVGIALSIVAGKVLAANFYGTSPRDPVVLVAASVTLLLAAAAACVAPMWTALRVDPVRVLRVE